MIVKKEKNKNKTEIYQFLMDWEINKVVLEVIRESDGLSIQLQIHVNNFGIL